jgi:feruloyl-CoA synthase
MVLSGNSIEHLVLTAGVPIVPVSTAYSLLCADHEHIRAVAELCRPGSGVSAPQRTSGPS